MITPTIAARRLRRYSADHRKGILYGTVTGTYLVGLILFQGGAVSLLLGFVPLLMAAAGIWLFRGIAGGSFLPGIYFAKKDAPVRLRVLRGSVASIGPTALFLFFGMNLPYLASILYGEKIEAALLGPALHTAIVPMVFLAVAGLYYIARTQTLARNKGQYLDRCADFHSAGMLLLLVTSLVLFVMLSMVSVAFSGVVETSADHRLGMMKKLAVQLGESLFTQASVPPIAMLLTALGLTVIAGWGKKAGFSFRLLSAHVCFLGSASSAIGVMIILANLGSPESRDMANFFAPVIQTLLVSTLVVPICSVVTGIQDRIRPEPPLNLEEPKVNTWVNTGALAVVIALLLGALHLAGGSLINMGISLAAVLLVVSMGQRRRGRLEKLVSEKTAQLEVQMAENERLILNILPESIAQRIKSGEGTIADSFESVSVLFADIVGFTVMSSKMSSQAVVAMLDELFREFDQVSMNRGVEKIKTIGDCYMAVAGLPEPRKDHADAILLLAQDMLAAVADFNQRKHTDIQVRIGVNSGHVVAGVIGTHKYIYDLWGDAVNTASRMESHGVPGMIQFTQATRDLLTKPFACQDGGMKDLKGKGPMQTWILGPREGTPELAQ